MSASPFVRTEVRNDRPSDAPMTLEREQGRESDPSRTTLTDWAARIPRAWIGMSGYLVAGVFLGLVLIVALSLTHSDPSEKTASAGVVTDNVVHLRAQQIGESCWRGLTKTTGARVTVSLEVGLDGKVRNAIASGESPTMRGCVESHIKGWEFLPQANPSQMVLPVEVER